MHLLANRKCKQLGSFFPVLETRLWEEGQLSQCLTELRSEQAVQKILFCLCLFLHLLNVQPFSVAASPCVVATLQPAGIRLIQGSSQSYLYIHKVALLQGLFFIHCVLRLQASQSLFMLWFTGYGPYIIVTVHS